MIRKSHAIAISVILGGAVFLGGAAVPITNHPTFCASCHTIKPSYDSWVQSSHREVQCVQCHVRPTLEGWVHDKVIAGLRDVYIYFLDTPPAPHDLRASVASGVCLSCHQNILRISEIAVRDLPPPVKEVGLIMSHRKHMEAFAARGQGEGCTTCHGRVVHDKPIKGYPIVIPRGHVSEDSQPYPPDHAPGSKLYKAAMTDCFRCHDGKSSYDGRILSRQCDTCHLSEKINTFLFE